LTLIVLQAVGLCLGGVLHLMFAFDSFERRDPKWKTAALTVSAFVFFALAMHKGSALI
jgi:hypothetical protein